MVNGQHLIARRLQALVHHEAHAFQEFVTERVILLAILAQDCPGKKDGGDWLDGTRRIGPGMRWEHPRPPQTWIPQSATPLQTYLSSFDQIEPVREVAFMENHFSFF